MNCDQLQQSNNSNNSNNNNNNNQNQNQNQNNNLFFKIFRNSILKNKLFDQIKWIGDTLRVAKDSVEIYSWLELIERPCQLIRYGYFEEFKTVLARVLSDRVLYRRPIEEFARSLVVAGAIGKLEFIQLVNECHRDILYDSVIILTTQNAIAQGHFHIVKYLHDNDLSLGFTSLSINMAAKYNRLDILEFLHRYRFDDCTEEAMDVAASNGHLHVVRWLHQNRTEGCSKLALDMAASKGYLEIVQFLHENRTEGSTEKALDWAASNGHIDIVKYLHKNRTEPCSIRAMNQVAAGGHTEIFKFLHRNRTEGYSSVAFRNACLNGHSEIIHYILQNQMFKSINDYDLEMVTVTGDLELIKSLHSLGFRPNGAIDTACAHGYLEILEYFTSIQMQGCTVKSMDLSAANGHLEIVKYLHNHRTEGCTTRALDAAATNGHLAIVEFLHSCRTEGCLRSTLGTATANGHVKVVKFLAENCTDCNKFGALNIAALHGRLDLVTYLLENIHQQMESRHLPISPNEHLYFINGSIEEAAKKGHLDIVRYLFEQYKIVERKAIAGGAVSASTFSNNQVRRYSDYLVIKYTIENHQSKFTYNALHESVKFGMLETFKLLYANRHLGINLNDDAIEQLVLGSSKYISIIDYYLSQKPTQQNDHNTSASLSSANPNSKSNGFLKRLQYKIEKFQFRLIIN
ncbi:hypothetical protein PPL_10998 [Heterostelium album PN500]|uniref:Ankyrin repeat-containing protein n=1 Tax=Heterostelium pallidum (strain ATCC 26659 / Pp 5 / PN500) TaxID=670386 RepID=D3BSM9_HETP5|nr:hypothetical protein PPL_10998 [Heterostelium album PN500]EFA75494.1 hypothetical protein PPL_10998 [Heterostelium album PN500]|eukprot:XP_020427628.1 hypothetical protein PPL_10998 [Heterostelium album PN500]